MMKMPEKLTTKAVAERMNGREYQNEITFDEEKELAFHGLVPRWRKTHRRKSRSHR